MKLTRREETHCSFLIGKRERDLLLSLLQRYPIVNSAHFRTRDPNKSEEAQKNHELLEEALAEQQRENRKQLEQMLNEPGRFVESDLGFTFRLSFSEIEWLLQVLNDIRVGAWIQLGQPGPGPEPELTRPLDEQTMVLAWTVEIAGLFQSALLQATDTAD